MGLSNSLSQKTPKSFLPEQEENQVMNKFLGYYDSEPEYRADQEAFNYSKLKDFVKDPLLVWRRKHLVRDYLFKSTPEMDYGSLVDCMQFEPHMKEERFGIASAPVPTGNGLKFVDALIDLILTNKTPGKGISDFFQDAYTTAGIKSPKFEKFITDNFSGTDLEVYFSEKLENRGKITLGADDFSAAERVLRMLEVSESTRDIFKYKGEHIHHNEETSEVITHVEGIPQLALKALVEGEIVRVMLDWTVIDHVKKTINPYDMKTTALGVEDFKFTFFKMKYYIQQGLYEAVVQRWAEDQYPGYTVEPFQFIVVDSSGFVEPLVYEIHAPEGQSFLRTFTLRDRVYKSGLDIIEDINYHIKNDLWTISRSNKQNKGRVQISL